MHMSEMKLLVKIHYFKIISWITYEAKLWDL